MEIVISLSGHTDTFEHAAQMIEVAAQDVRAIGQERAMGIDTHNKRGKEMWLGPDCFLHLKLIVKERDQGLTDRDYEKTKSR
jgi:hypothetical protein